MTLHHESAGHGPHLLFIHGWGMHGGLWRDWARALQQDFTTTLIDLPGHGHSPPAPLTLAGLADALAPFIREETTVVGWSLGAMVALALAEAHPRRVARLVLVGGTARFCTGPDWPHAMAPDTLAAFARQLERDRGRALQRFLALQAHGGREARALARRLQDLLGARPPARNGALGEGLALLRDSDLRAGLARITQPTLFLHGEEDAVIPCPAAHACARRMPAARVRPIPAAGHVPFLTHPEVCARYLQEFCHGH